MHWAESIASRLSAKTFLFLTGTTSEWWLAWLYKMSLRYQHLATFLRQKIPQVMWLRRKVRPRESGHVGDIVLAVELRS